MAKPGIEVQVRKWLEGRRRWLRSGGNHLIRYFSVMLGNNDQVDALTEFFTADTIPDWLYVERDGNRITLVGLSVWRDDQTVESDEIPASVWDMLAQLHVEHARLSKKLSRVEAERDEYHELCQHITDPRHAAPAGVEAAPVAEPVDCECSTLRQKLDTAERKITGLESAGKSNRELIKSLKADRSAAQAAQRTAEQALNVLKRQSRDVLIEQLGLIMQVTNARRVERAILHRASLLLARIVPMLEGSEVQLPDDTQVIIARLSA